MQAARVEARLRELALAVINAGTMAPGEWALRQQMLVRLAREITDELAISKAILSSGDWPEHCEQRAFVEGMTWWQFVGHGATAFPSERQAAEVEAVKRFGWPDEPKPADCEASLIAATELVCRYLGENLADGYEVHLCVSRADASIELIGPDDDDTIHVDSEFGCSILRLMCDASKDQKRPKTLCEVFAEEERMKEKRNA